MANLDSIEAMKKLDPEGFLPCIQEFPDQCQRAWNDWKHIALPARFVQTKNILICGMGGSAIPGSLTMNFVQNEVAIPITMWRDYGIPGFVSKDTLVIAVSVSGNTEETLDCLRKSAEKTDKLVTLSIGGDLEILSRKYKTIHYKINYTGQPRAAVGFTLISVLAIFSKLKLIELSDDDFQEALVLLRALQKKIDINIFTSSNNAKILARKLEGKIPILMGAGVMSQVARHWALSFNENAKTAAYFQEIPEMNHNALVGLEMPKLLGQKIMAIILQSRFDYPRTKIRESVMIQIFQKRRIPVETILIDPAPSPLSELLQILFLGAYTSFYLGMINDLNPYTIEVVDFLKEKLAEKPFEDTPSTSFGTSQGRPMEG